MSLTLYISGLEPSDDLDDLNFLNQKKKKKKSKKEKIFDAELEEGMKVSRVFACVSLRCLLFLLPYLLFL